MTAEMSGVLVLQVLLLLAAANGAPVIAKKLLGGRFASSIDFGVRLGDGQPVFGASKTWRGLASSLLAASVVAPVVGVEWYYGALVADFAMVGDLVSSFIKRRLGYRPSSMAPGLDQIPESHLPAIALSRFMDLTIFDIAAIVVGFWLGALILSRLLFRIGWRDRPY